MTQHAIAPRALSRPSRLSRLLPCLLARQPGAALALIVGAAVLGVPVASAERPQTSTKVKVSWPVTSAPAGTAVAVTGTLTDSVRKKRKVRLEQKTGSGWLTVDSAKASRRSGDVSLTVPTDWFYTSKLRVVTPRIRSAAGDASKAQKVSVVPAYVPAGSPDAWQPISRKYTYRFNPCQRITYRVNATGAPVGAVEAVAAATAQISQATGIRFADQGTTDAVPGSKKRWPKHTGLVVAWTHPDGTSWPLAGPEAARGGPVKTVWGRSRRSTRENGHRLVLTRAAGVVVDTTQPMATYDGTVRLLMHEIGHTMGLGHGTDAAQIMEAHSDLENLPTQWGAGDLAGLAKVGLQQGCVTAQYARDAVLAPVPVLDPAP